MDNTRQGVNLRELLKEEVLHIFGYGSLVWKPDFDFDSRECGIIKGLKRVFWQESKHHRGTDDNPGRVLTAVEKEDSIIHGVTYHVSGEERKKKALESLGIRENLLGGYTTMLIDFFPASDSCISPQPSCKAVLYVALPHNELYGGYKPEEEIARQVSNCAGVSGRNSEYILKLAEFMRLHFPSVQEEHLYKIEYWVKVFDAQKLQSSNSASKTAGMSKAMKQGSICCSYMKTTCSATGNVLECSGKQQPQKALTSSFKVDSRSTSPTPSRGEDIYDGEEFVAESVNHFSMQQSESNRKTVSLIV